MPLKQEYSFSEVFRRKDLPHIRHIMLKAAKLANREQRKVYDKSKHKSVLQAKAIGN